MSLQELKEKAFQLPESDACGERSYRLELVHAIIKSLQNQPSQ
jgi:hypothetical protein